MTSAIISLIFGVLGFLGFPIMLPALGIGLGANALIKEGQKEDSQKKIKVLGIAGMVISAMALVLFFATRTVA